MDGVTFENFEKITGEDIKSFFQDFVDFSDQDYQNIVSYYTRGDELLSETVNNLEDLTTQAVFFKNVIENHIDSLSTTYDYWELVDNFELVCQKIETINNSQKWFKSTKELGFTDETQKDYILRQQQTLASLSSELGYQNPNDDWIDIALSNKLKEEDYSIEGGVKLKVSFQNNFNYKVNSVIDSISGEKVYGLDLDKKIQYVDDDLKALTYRETIEQSYGILLGLVKGTNPEFPESGISPDLVGGNVNHLQYPAIFRQLTDVFGSDDSFTEFTITDIIRDQDQIFINTSVKTRMGEVLNQTLKVS